MIRFGLTTLLTGLIVWVLLQVNESLRWVSPPSFGNTILTLVMTLTIIIFFYLSQRRLQNYFTQLYLLSMVVKLLAYCGYMLVIVMKDRGGAVSNVIFFLAVYLLFTVLEIGFLYRNVTRPGRRQ